jgi:hypothetical protein
MEERCRQHPLECPWHFVVIHQQPSKEQASHQHYIRATQYDELNSLVKHDQTADKVGHSQIANSDTEEEDDAACRQVE